MPLTDKDIQKIAELLTPVQREIADVRRDISGVKDDISGFREQVDAQFTEVQNNFEGLYARDEKREQEYLLLRGQIARLEERVDAISKRKSPEFPTSEVIAGPVNRS